MSVTAHTSTFVCCGPNLYIVFCLLRPNVYSLLCPLRPKLLQNSLACYGPNLYKIIWPVTAETYIEYFGLLLPHTSTYNLWPVMAHTPVDTTPVKSTLSQIELNRIAHTSLEALRIAHTSLEALALYCPDLQLFSQHCHLPRGMYLLKSMLHPTRTPAVATDVGDCS